MAMEMAMEMEMEEEMEMEGEGEPTIGLRHTRCPPHRFFRHERLIAYRLAVVVARWIRYEARFPPRDNALKDQARRAADSVVLNLAEGCYREGRDRQYHFRVAMGSAAECGSVLDLQDIPGASQKQEDLRRVVALILGLV